MDLLLERYTVNLKTTFIFLMLELFVQNLSEKKFDVLFVNLEKLAINPFCRRYPY